MTSINATGFSPTPENILATTPLILNEDLLAAIETQVDLTSVKQFEINARGCEDVRLAFVAGETATNYLTINAGSSRAWSFLDSVDLSVFLLSDNAETVEIIVWS